MPAAAVSTHHRLPRRIRQRGLIVLLAHTYLMWSGFFMIVPVLSVHYVGDLGWAAPLIGTVLGVRQLLQQTLTVVGGALADRLGARRLIVIGLAIRVIAFGGMAWALDFPGAVTQGFDLPDARLMIASALEDLAQALLEEGRPLPVPSENAQSADADLIELVPLSVHAGTAPK